jgi:Asp-tRNA(Asn)/Glu-tRNA(Gln) amidotransferase A subunit family amidase
VAGRTAEAVAHLEAAGYVNLGKTNQHEFACGISTYDSDFGEAPNPRRTTGG